MAERLRPLRLTGDDQWSLAPERRDQAGDFDSQIRECHAKVEGFGARVMSVHHSTCSLGSRRDVCSLVDTAPRCVPLGPMMVLGFRTRALAREWALRPGNVRY